MKLYLMRHGQAASPQDDPEQGLSATGRAEIEQLAKRLSDKGLLFKQVLHSDKARARQTAEIMAAVVSADCIPQQRAGLKPNDDPRLLLPDISNWPSNTLLVSHLPFVPGLIALLSVDASPISMIPGTVVCLRKEAAKWQIEWVETP